MKYKPTYCQFCGVPVKESAYVNGVYLQNVCLSSGCADEERDQCEYQFTDLDDAYIYYIRDEDSDD